MSSNILLSDLPTNLIAFIYQYLSVNDMVKSACCCKKMLKAFKQDFIYIELAKRDILFLPAESDKFESWKDYFNYLQQLRKNISSGKPNVGYKMNPYRGHKSPIEALAIFHNKKTFDSTIVSGDSNGEVVTWNLEEDEDGDLVNTKDLILTCDSSIVGIKSLNDDSHMLVWTNKNKFYYYSVNMFKTVKKNSERFQLEKQFNIEDNDYPIKQIFNDEEFSTIFMSPNFSDDYKLNHIYAYSLKTYTIDKYTFNYNSSQTNLVLNGDNPNNNNNNNNIGWNAFNNPNNNVINPLILFPINIPQIPHHPINYNKHKKESRKKNINYFVVTEDKLISYINKEPVRKRNICEYNNKKLLPNVFVFKKTTRIHQSYHIDLDYIENILPINNEEVAFIGTYTNNNNKKQVIMKIYKLNFFTVSREIVLHDHINNNFELILYKNPEMYYLIDDKELKKLENIQIKQLKINKLGNLKEIPNINCIESDEFRIAIASDEQYLAVLDIKTGKLWFNLLAGSKTVQPKSFVNHPNYQGFHIIEVTRNSIVAVIGNLIREYKFTFKYR